MSDKSSIEWTEATWNPLAGCSEISPGCLNCYAAVMARRLAGMGQKKYQGTTKKLPNGKTAWTGKMNLDEAALQIPLKSKKPTMYFVNSMSDLFHDDVPDEFIDKVFAVMALCPQHTFQVLTKRAERMREYMANMQFRASEWDDGEGEIEEFIITALHDDDDVDKGLQTACRKWLETFNARNLGWPLPNVWLGVSVENKKHGLPRIPFLLQTPAAVRFLSVEPLLEDLGDVSEYLTHWSCKCPCHDSARPEACTSRCKAGIGHQNGIDWVIVGGESGPGSRPYGIAWPRNIIEQCKAAGVPVFHKQLGSNPVYKEFSLNPPFEFTGMVNFKIRDKKGGDLRDFPEDLRVREMPEKASVPS